MEFEGTEYAVVDAKEEDNLRCLFVVPANNWKRSR
jgi:hypothetical protein